MAKILLNVLPPEQYFEGIIKIFQKDIKKKKVIYVTTNKPYNHIINLFKKKNIDTDNILFIDCISMQVMPSEAKKEIKNCIFIKGPAYITDISIAINKAITLIQGEKVLVLDSLSALLIYNSEDVVGKFSNFVINKMRVNDISTIMLILGSDVDRKIIKTIESFVDEVKKNVV